LVEKVLGLKFIIADGWENVNKPKWNMSVDAYFTSRCLKTVGKMDIVEVIATGRVVIKTLFLM
jgi:hypothetical protein